MFYKVTKYITLSTWIVHILNKVLGVSFSLWSKAKAVRSPQIYVLTSRFAGLGVAL